MRRARENFPKNGRVIMKKGETMTRYVEGIFQEKKR